MSIAVEIPNKPKQAKGSPIDRVLREIQKIFPSIKNTDIELFTNIYYPIAILEIEMQELTFEDFERVQLSILKIFSLGFKEAELIGDFLGLKANYVHKVLHLLEGYGHIYQGQVTQIGRRSLEEEKKIIVMNTRQKFQADALNLSLIKLDRSISDSMLYDKKDTELYTPHLKGLEGISIEEIVGQLGRDKLENFKKYRGSILHANVEEIIDVKCLELNYAESYLLKLKGIEDPFIFTRRYDPRVSEFSRRFSWQPFCIPQEGLREKLNLDKDIPIHSEIAREYIMGLYHMIKERSRALSKEKILEELQYIYPFNNEEIEIPGDNWEEEGTLKQIQVKINQDSFTQLTNKLYFILKDFDVHEGGLIPHKRLSGRIIKLTTQDPLLLKTIGKIQALCLEIGDKRLYSYIKSQIEEKKEEIKRERNPIKSLFEILQNH